MNTAICRALSVAAKQEASCHDLMIQQMQWLRGSIIPICKASDQITAFTIQDNIETQYYKTQDGDMMAEYEYSAFEFQVCVSKEKLSFSMQGIQSKFYVEFYEVLHG